ncbi:MAG TPA: glycosyltransferase [Pyrinomonadaceae bacterium]|jgi:glycosyltransferase involved in cell wall biosynthesis
MKRELPFCSIIVPTFERPAQLAQCLQALSLLDYPPQRFEVILVDDESSTSPAVVVDGFRGRMDVKLLTQRHAGPAAARNFGATHACGEFLAFTDDDCAPEACWLRTLAARLSETPDRIVGGRTLNALTSNPYSATSQLIIDVVYEYFNPDPHNARFFASNNFALSAQHFHALGGFDVKFRTSEDREFCDRWLATGRRMTYAPEALLYHSHPLTLATLWRQHFGYGRGARRFHLRRESRGAPTFKPDAAFYLKLLRASIPRAPKPSAVLMPALMLWVQLANAAGFFHERSRSKQTDALRIQT